MQTFHEQTQSLARLLYLLRDLPNILLCNAILELLVLVGGPFKYPLQNESKQNLVENHWTTFWTYDTHQVHTRLPSLASCSPAGSSSSRIRILAVVFNLQRFCFHKVALTRIGVAFLSRVSVPRALIVSHVGACEIKRALNLGNQTFQSGKERQNTYPTNATQ